MVEAHLVKAFTQDTQSGNPAGVVLDEVNEEQMPQLANLLGFPATAFVKTTSSRDFSIRFFSPASESGLCVHALLAAAHVLIPAESTNAYRFQTKTHEVEVSRHSDGALMVILPDPEFGSLLADIEPVAAAINIDPGELSDDPVQVVSTGKPKILIPFKSLAGLKAMTPDMDLLKDLCLANSAQGIFAFTPETALAENDFHARHFNPLTLSVEDPICGVGSGALASYLVHNNLLSNPRLRIEMGHTTNLPGTVFVEIGEAMTVGGFAVNFGSRAIEIETST